MLSDEQMSMPYRIVVSNRRVKLGVVGCSNSRCQSFVLLFNQSRHSWLSDRRGIRALKPATLTTKPFHLPDPVKHGIDGRLNESWVAVAPTDREINRRKYINMINNILKSYVTKISWQILSRLCRQNEKYFGNQAQYWSRIRVALCVSIYALLTDKMNLPRQRNPSPL